MAKNARLRRQRRDAAKRKRVATPSARQVNAMAEVPDLQRAAARESHPASATPPRAGGSKPAVRPSGEMLAMPERIRQRFVAARNIYYFPGGARAFVDHGDRLTTRSERKAVIDSLAAIAQARGWRQIEMAGTDRFKQQLWLAANLAGLAVRHFSPSSHLQATLARALARRGREAPAVARATSAPREWRGRLIDHGPAPYRHQSNHRASYFITLRSARGDEQIWGVDLQRALAASATRVTPGDTVVLRRVADAQVTSSAGARRPPGDAARSMSPARYVIETPAFWAARGEMARLVRDPSVPAPVASREHPTLAVTYLQLRAAQLVAGRWPHPEDRRGFLARVRDGLADALARGEPVGTLRVRTRALMRSSRAERSGRAAAPLRG